MIIDPFRESIEKCRETQQAIAGKLERLIEFDKSSATIFSDIQELLADVETGIEQVTSHKAWNETTETFHIKNWDLSWATRINEKKELGPNEVDHIQASSEEEQIKAFLNSGKEGTPFDPNDFADPYDEPITVADKMEVLGGNSPLSGTPDGLAGPAMFAFNVGKGVGTGAYNIVDDTVEGLVTTVMHPIDTASSLGNAVLHPINTYGIITDAFNTSYDRDMRNGYAESRARRLTYASGTILTSVVVTKGAGTVMKTGSSTPKPTIQQVRNTTDSAMSNYVNPFGPELAVSSGVNVPYGVLNGSSLKDELLLFAKDFKSGRLNAGGGKGNTVLSYGNRSVPSGPYRTVNGFPVKVKPGAQEKHILNTPNYEQELADGKNKSIFYGDNKTAQELLDKFAGKGQRLPKSSRERVDFGEPIGKYYDLDAGEYLETTRGMIHYGKDGAHIVPAEPLKE